jgi:hypothetical protein
VPRLPKHPSKLRRSNSPSWVLLPAKGRTEPAPELSAEYPWYDWTRAYWARIWSSPMATQWSEWDVPALQRLAKLQEDALLGGAAAKVGAEIRQLEDRFGLNPKARRTMGWQIEGEDLADDPSPDVADDASAGPNSDASSVATAETDPRRLRVVGGQGT